MEQCRHQLATAHAQFEASYKENTERLTEEIREIRESRKKLRTVSVGSSVGLTLSHNSSTTGSLEQREEEEEEEEEEEMEGGLGEGEMKAEGEGEGEGAVEGEIEGDGEGEGEEEGEGEVEVSEKEVDQAENPKNDD